MDLKWSTKKNDMQVARLIIDEYADDKGTETLGLFELVVGSSKPQRNLRLSGWVVALSDYFQSTYGSKYGDFVTKMVISKCISNGQTMH